MISGKLRSFIDKEIGSVYNTCFLSDKNNDVFLLETKHEDFILKIYKQKGLHQDIELYARKTLGDADFIRQMVLFDNSRNIIDTDFAIFKHYRGHTLLHIINENRLHEYDLEKIGKQIAQVLLHITRHTIKGCGFIDSEGRTSHMDWISFLLDYQTPTIRSLMKSNLDPTIYNKMYDFIISNHELLNCIDYSLCPIDLNMDNFLITHSSKVVFLDVGGMIAGNLLMSIGEYSGHTFGTPLHDVVLKCFDFSDDHLRQVHLYAAMMNLNVLAFIAKNKLGDLYKAKPWGNNMTFIESIDTHMQVVANR